MLVKIKSSGRVVIATRNQDGSFWIVGRNGVAVFDPVDGSLAGGASVHGPYLPDDARFSVVNQ